jgi:hypothetical protein
MTFKILGFVFFFVIAHLGLLSLPLVVAVNNPFIKTKNFAVQQAYDQLPLSGKIRAKYYHALNQPAYPVGLFGNSRIVMVGHKELGISMDQMFNFAIGGTSFLQSVTLLESLAKAGKAPEISIISIDHPELQFFNYPYWSEPFSYMSIIADNVQLAYERSKSPIEAFNFLNTSRIFTWNQTKQLWNIDAVRRYFNFLFAKSANIDVIKTSHQPMDGSRHVEPITEKNLMKFPVINQLSPLSNAYLETYIMRLGRLVRNYGLQIIIYESPIEPQTIKRLEENKSSYALTTRNKIFAMCAIEKLDCRQAPIINAVKGGPYWPDCCHAPAEQLGRYIRNLIDQAVPRGLDAI